MSHATQQHLGFFWNGDFTFYVPRADSIKSALRAYKQDLASITWHTLTTLENTPVTLPQTETILQGKSVADMDIDDMMQVKRYGDAAKNLISMLENNSFFLNKETACTLHNIAGKDEALTWGKLRDGQVTIRNVDYTPPASSTLPALADTGFTFLREQTADPVERAFAVFLFMARSQFFHDVNKRTASLMMNGVLLSESYFPVIIQNRHTEEFHDKLRAFYNSGDASDMMAFLDANIREIYTPDVNSSYDNQG